MSRPSGGRRRSALISLAAALLFVSLAAAPAASSQPAEPGVPELFNLEHVYNFNPEDHDPGRHPMVGSDLEFFTHSVPLRDYSTGALVDADGNPLPAGSDPVFGQRDFAVVGSYERGGYVFDITDPENPAFVTVVTCRQERNDVAIKKFTDPATGETRVVLALTQQSGNPCGGQAGVGVRVNSPASLEGFYTGNQWIGTAPIADQTADLVYAGTGCTPAHYATVDVEGKIALVDKFQGRDVTDVCQPFTFKQKMESAESAGAIGLIQVDNDDTPSAGNAIESGIPGLEIHNSDGVPIREAVIAGETVNGSLTDGPSDIPLLGSGSGGIGVFDITDPFEYKPMYLLRTGLGGVHNFAFHPNQPFGYVSNGALPGGLNVIPIVDFTDLDNPVVRVGPETEGGVHDIEFSVDGTRAYAGSENNHRIYDTADAANPVLLSRTPNIGTYAHGAFPDSAKEIMVTNNESLALGGFLAPGVCPGEGLASYNIAGSNENAPIGPLGIYVPHTTGPSERPCTSHFGRFVPGTKIMSIGWYIAGVRVVDWSNPVLPVEVAGAVMPGTNTWAAKIYKGPYVYAGDIGRGFDVFRWSGDGPAPWTVTAEDDVIAATGGGWLATTDSGKANFGFDVDRTGSELTGSLRFKDKGAGVEISLGEPRSLGEVMGECGSMTAGPNTVELTGDGTLNGAPASFRVCVSDNGEPGASPNGSDRFYLECTMGCQYDSGSRTADDVLDGGNVQVSKSEETSSGEPAATTMILDPLLMGESALGTLQTFSVSVFDQDQEPMQNASIELRVTSATGVTVLQGVTGSTGVATIVALVPTSGSEFIATSGSATSNAIEVDPLG